jgi:acid phosphatase (class A)
MRRSLGLPTAAAVALAALLLVPVPRASAYYISPAQVDLDQILAPPPAPDSPQGRADLAAVLAAQQHRTPADAASVKADVQLSVFRFADVMGPGFTAERLPFAAEFFARTAADDEAAIEPAKRHFNRKRPFAIDFAVKPVVAAMTYGAYPSGHATFAYAAAILLAIMVPEKAAAIFARADRFAENRVIGGVHYPTDIEAGKIAGSVIDNVMLHDARFRADFAHATAEVRRALGLAPLSR